MASPQNQRLRRAAEKAARRKAVVAEKRKADMAATAGSEARQIKEAARAPVHTALVMAELFEIGIGHVVMSRALPSGSIAAGVFLVDVWCLGVKNAFFSVMTRSEFFDFLESADATGTLAEASPEETRGLLHGAVAYAASFGFPPHEDYAKVEAIFGDIAVVEPERPFGRDGGPLFVPGPYDTPVKIKRVMEAIARVQSDASDGIVVRLDTPPADFVDL